MSVLEPSLFCARTVCRLILAAGMVFTAFAQAQVSLTQLSVDTFTDTPSQHATEVEPSAFSHGSTIVSAFQVARIWGGGGADIGFATSTNGGATWTNGYLPGITIYQGGTSSAASDAAVAYAALHNFWLISSLPIGNNTSVAVTRSTVAINWSTPIRVTASGSASQHCILCHNPPPTPHLSHLFPQAVHQSQS